MVINDLVQAYDRLTKNPDCEINQDGFCFKAVENLVVIDSEGDLKEIVTVSTPVREKLPENLCPGGVKRNILYDTFEYFFGLKAENGKLSVAIDGKSKDKNSKFEGFKNANLELLEGVESETAKAIVKYLKKWDILKNAENPIFFTTKADGTKSLRSFKGNFSFCLNSINGKCFRDQAIVGEIKARVAKKNAEAKPDGVCCITGKVAKIAQKHKSFSGSQNYLISVDNDTKSFHSYGKTWCFDSPVSEEVMNKYTAVLEYFYRSGSKNKISWGDDTLMFWADCDSSKVDEEVSSMFGILPEGDAGKQEEEKIKLALQQMKQGIVPAAFETPENTQLYFLLLSKNSARFAVRKYYRTKFGDFRDSVLQHHLDMELKGIDKPIPIWQLTNATIPSTTNNGKANPSFCEALADAVLDSKTKYPDSMFAEMVARVKTDNPNNDTKLKKAVFENLTKIRFAFIKAYLVRMDKQNKELTMTLNLQNKEEAYLLGRLFAVMEKTQQDAIKNINSTIKDRFFAAACSTPKAVFPSLLVGYIHNASKLENRGERYEKVVREIYSKLADKEFSKQFTVGQQGLFSIGYYHQLIEL